MISYRIIGVEVNDPVYNDGFMGHLMVRESEHKYTIQVSRELAFYDKGRKFLHQCCGGFVVYGHSPVMEVKLYSYDLENFKEVVDTINEDGDTWSEEYYEGQEYRAIPQ